MENTLENKAKFFGLYYGQQLQGVSVNDDLWDVDYDSFIRLEEEGFLQLNPISNITDEDAVECLKHLRRGERISSYDYCKSQNYDCEQMTRYFKRHNLLDYSLQTMDYLRSKGYALPFMGLSVEKMIEYGWVKLKDK